MPRLELLRDNGSAARMLCSDADVDADVDADDGGGGGGGAAMAAALLVAALWMTWRSKPWRRLMLLSTNCFCSSARLAMTAAARASRCALSARFFWRSSSPAPSPLVSASSRLRLRCSVSAYESSSGGDQSLGTPSASNVAAMVTSSVRCRT